MSVVAYALSALATIPLVPVSVLLLQIIVAAMPSRSRSFPEKKRPRVVILVPAHDEGTVIAATMRSITAQLGTHDRVLVVADNCTDDTASVAAGAGANVVERRDAKRPGKNYALEFGVSYLETDPPSIVIIVDADCQIEPGAIDRLARECDATRRPVQGLYLMLAPPGGRSTTQVAAFAWIVKNWIRPLGMKRLGLACQLMGSGTAFPWEAIAGFRIANSEMAEDYKFGIEMALAGFPAVFCPDAKVTSYFPSKKTVEQTQRTRWEHGHLQLILRDAPRLLVAGLRQRNAQLAGLAVDLAIPPLAFLSLTLSLFLLVGAVYALLAAVYLPLGISVAGSCLFALAVGIAWRRWGRTLISAPSLFFALPYVIGKIPLYVRFFTKRQKVWIKTKRD
jgi:cellulose synthase/poly-beta-1,6-N-acetylglucosamine synthase-like glycosyltransferase